MQYDLDSCRVIETIIGSLQVASTHEGLLPDLLDENAVGVETISDKYSTRVGLAECL